MKQKNYVAATIVAIIFAFIGSLLGIASSQSAIFPLWLKITWIAVDLTLFVFVFIKGISYSHHALALDLSSEDLTGIMGASFVGVVVYLIFIGICFYNAGYAALSYVFLVLLCLACYIDVHWTTLLERKQESTISKEEEVTVDEAK